MKSMFVFVLVIISCPVFSQGNLRIEQQAKMRKTDSPLSDMLLIIPEGTIVKTVSFNSGFYKVEYRGRVGYINEMYFKKTSTSNSSSRNSGPSTTRNQTTGNQRNQAEVSDKINGEFTCSESYWIAFDSKTDQITSSTKQSYRNFTMRFEDFDPIIGAGSLTLLDFDRNQFFKFNFFNLIGGSRITRDNGEKQMEIKYMALDGEKNVIIISILINETTYEYRTVIIEIPDRGSNRTIHQVFDNIIRTK